VVLPSGTVTFLFTDIEGSTRLLHERGSEGYARELAAHRAVLRAAFAAHDGVEVETQGDAFFVAFPRASDALAAAVRGREGLLGTAIRVRMGVHTGEPLVTGDGYVGIDVHRAARIAAAGHGGQILVSAATRDLAPDAELLDLGEYRLKDLTRAERLFQLGEGDFPPLKSLNRTNLPVAAWPLIGRERELEAIRGHVAAGTRLLTLTGPGGSGKTRLALQAAADLADDFSDGVFFVALAPLRDVAAVHAAVAQALELQPDDDVVARLAASRLLLVLDNAEHLAGVERVVGELLVGDVVALVTSRAPLHLAAERELAVDPLPQDAAVELFVTRAAAVGRLVVPEGVVVELCRRLDNLPLALELAAARTKLLSPNAMLERLDAALPLLRGGARDLPERQQTLRATIAWSHDLLEETERAAFRRLSVFRGTCGIDAAEAVADAGFDELASLVDKSLLKPVGDDRFLMLETLREFAREQLEQAGEATQYTLRHARHYLNRLEEIDPVLRGPRTAEFLAWFDEEEDNLRAALDRLLAHDVIEAARLAVFLSSYWTARGRFLEGQDRLRALDGRDELPDGLRARVLQRLADHSGRLDDLDECTRAAEKSFALASGVGDHATAADALLELGWVAHLQLDAPRAIAYGERAVTEASLAGERRLVIRCAAQVGVYLTGARRFADARPVLQQAVDGFRELGDRTNEAIVLENLGVIDYRLGDYEQAHAGVEAAIEMLRSVGQIDLAEGLRISAYALLALGRRREARERAVEALDLAIEIAQIRVSTGALAAIALTSAEADPDRAARLLGAVAELRRRSDIVPEREDVELEQLESGHIVAALGEEAYALAHATGASLSFVDATQLARELATLAVD
jgi:predicted ATPase/class 3 adenylate cyclase